ncbi:M23 family metallopeptidase [Bacillus aquiflavi]|uniref:peptidoglycan DD-metalloendopeptidase family protein n=1 Tax=Bacillus aquiflavi TaxID=2672567 RepID=UPI001CA9D169|nr:M23 family metallopeptidase [Bacillus aquiflavi]UAC48133.1 M23 family metallopeptidase [Bacillus aquiflavi]
MNALKESLSKIKDKTSIAVATGLAVFSLTFASEAAIASEENLKTVYHVYVDHEYAGVTSDKKVVESLIQDKKNELKKTYEQYEFVVGNDITYIPEQVFRSTSQNEEVVEKVNEQVKLLVKAAAVEIDGNRVVYVEDEQAAQDVIRRLKLYYVSADELNGVEASKASDQPLPPLKQNESRLLDISFSKNVSVSDGETSLDQIMTVDEAVNLLQKGTLQEKTYEVKAGDALESIAALHQLTTAELVSLNPGLTEEAVIEIGQQLKVKAHEPYFHVMMTREVNEQEAIPFQTEVIEDSSMYTGDTKVKQQGQEGIRAVTYTITQQNGEIVNKEITKEKVIKDAVNHITIKGTKSVPSRGNGQFIWPTNGGYISSYQGQRWGKLHKGIDIARPSNRTIKAADNGVVVSAGWHGGYGNKVEIDHKNGFRTVYAHLASINVKAGQTVSAGANLGVMGSTGNSTGVHLHFEVYKNGKLQNPMSYLR